MVLFRIKKKAQCKPQTENMYKILLSFKNDFIFPIYSNSLVKYLADKITMNKHI